MREKPRQNSNNLIRRLKSEMPPMSKCFKKHWPVLWKRSRAFLFLIINVVLTDYPHCVSYLLLFLLFSFNCIAFLMLFLLACFIFQLVQPAFNNKHNLLTFCNCKEGFQYQSGGFIRRYKLLSLAQFSNYFLYSWGKKDSTLHRVYGVKLP